MSDSLSVKGARNSSSAFYGKCAQKTVQIYAAVYWSEHYAFQIKFSHVKTACVCVSV